MTIDLTTNEIDQQTASTFKTMGVRLYVDYHENKIYVNKTYWNRLPDIAKQALTIVAYNKKDTDNE